MTIHIHWMYSQSIVVPNLSQPIYIDVVVPNIIISIFINVSLINLINILLYIYIYIYIYDRNFNLNSHTLIFCKDPGDWTHTLIERWSFLGGKLLLGRISKWLINILFNIFSWSKISLVSFNSLICYIYILIKYITNI